MREVPRILIVDDEEVLASFVAKILVEEKEFSYDVAVAGTGEDAVSMFEKEPFDLLIADIKLPEMDGIDVLRSVKSVDPETQVVMITAYASLETAVAALREGAYDYIVKPFEAKQVQSVVRHALERRSLILQRNELIQSLSEANDRLTEAHKLLEEKKALVDKELEQRIRELASLNELAGKLSSELDLQRLLGSTPKLACEVMKAEAGAVVFAEDEKFLVKSSFGLDDILPKGMRLPFSQEPFASVLRKGRSERAASWKPEGGKGEGLFLACAVLKGVTGKGFGVLCVARTKRSFTDKGLELLSTIGSAASIALQNALSFDHCQRGYLESLLSLLLVEETKHPSLRGHSERVAALAVNIAKALDLPEEEAKTIRYAALLHDLGKVGVRDELLTKTGLSEEELAELNESLLVAEKIITPLKFLQSAKLIVRHQAERHDGTGIPDKLSGDEIPTGSKILAVANYCDEASSGALEGKKLAVDEVISRLGASSGSLFAPEVVEAAIQVLKQKG